MVIGYEVMPEFPKIVPRMNIQGGDQRYLKGGPSVTEIIVLDDSGERRNQFGPGGHFGVYFWNGA